MAININIPIEDAVTDGSLNPVTSNAVFDALANKVPYTGATADVDLGEFELKSGQIEFDQAPTGTAGVAVMRWNDTDGTVDLGLKGGNVTLQVGQEQVLRVVNKTATNVNLLEANYQAVRVTGAQGQRLKVDLAQATTDLLSAETIGLVTETINNNQEGFITTSGLIRNINTTGSIQSETWVDGDILYLSPTVAGRVTNVKPSAPNHLIIVGYVVSAHITQGSIFVKVDNGYELDELHNVAITSVANKDLLQYDSATSLWKNESLSTAGIQPTLVSATNIKTINGNSLLGSGDLVISGGGGITVGTTAVTSGTVGRVFFQGTGDVVQQSASLFWDNTNARLGVGATPATTVRLDVRAQGALSTDIAFRVRNSADTQNLISIAGDGRVAIGLNAQILGTTDAFKNVVIGGGAKDISAAGVTENAVAFGFNAVSNNGGTAIGANTSITGVGGVAVGASAIAGLNSIAIGVAARADGTSGYQSLAIGYGSRASALLSGIIAVGQQSYTNALGQTLAFCVDPSGANSQTMLLTNKANLVFRNSTQLTSGTHWNTTATNTLTIHNGTIPNGNIVDAIQFYSADIVAGNAAPHFRTENGDIIKLYRETTAVTASTLVSNLGTILTDTDTIDGYTLKQVVKALRNLGILA